MTSAGELLQMMMKPQEINPPLSASDRRPSDRPFYIQECCEECGIPLIYHDLLFDESGNKIDPDEVNWSYIYFDEFCCPKCKNGVYMDWPPDALSGKLIIF